MISWMLLKLSWFKNIFENSTQNFDNIKITLKQSIREFDHATYEGSDREMLGREIDNLEETLNGRKYVGYSHVMFFLEDREIEKIEV